MEPKSKASTIVTVIVIAVAVIAFTYWYFWLRQPAIPEEAPTLSVGAAEEETVDLGSQLYEEISNPLSGKIPDLNPVANPLEGIYQNPFE